jgi:hypothetical protein
MSRAARRMTRYVTEPLGGLLAGSSFAVTLTLGVALFVGRVVLRPPLRGARMDDLLDHVVGPAALVFGLLGFGLGVVRAARSDRDAPALAAAPAPDGIPFLSAVTIAIVSALVAGVLAWPWVLVTWSERGVDPTVLLGVLSGPVAVGLVAFVAWRLLRRRPAATEPARGGLRGLTSRSSPALLGLALGSSSLLAAGTFGAVADWHPFFFILGGVPLIAAMFCGHLLGCLWFFRPLPPRHGG